MPESTTIIGAMSGSSLDGLDLLVVNFAAQAAPQPGQLNYKVLESATLPYSEAWCKRLSLSAHLPQDALYALHQEYGHYLGELVRSFLHSKELEADFLAMHGHTVYHEPAQGFTFQLGDNQRLAQSSQLSVISDFRQQDINSGGQGAPLAPIVEQWFLPDNQLFLNLGGIANLSYHTNNQVIGFDIGVANQLLNALAQLEHKAYDDKGALASKGEILPDLLKTAKTNAFFSQMPPKSLSNQWVQEQINPLFLQAAGTVADRLATANALIAWQLKHALEQIGAPTGGIFVTGGGAYNLDLIKRMEALLPNEIILPSPFWIEQKEALLMALMGYLKINDIPNVIGAVTGSKLDQCCGNIYLPNQL